MNLWTHFNHVSGVDSLHLETILVFTSDQVRTLQQRQHAAADAAYQEADAEVSLEARVTFKKMAGALSHVSLYRGANPEEGVQKCHCKPRMSKS